MAGEASGCCVTVERGDRRVGHGLPVDLAAFAPGIERHALDDSTSVVGDGVDRAEMITVQIVHCLTIAGNGFGDNGEVTDIMFQLRAVSIADPFIRLACRIDRGDGSISHRVVNTLEALAVRAVEEVYRGGAFGDACWLVKRRVGNGPAIASGHVAIGIITVGGVFGA